MRHYDSIIDALEDLRLRGYTFDFNIKDDRIFSHDGKIHLHPHEFEIVETHRIENNTDPDESAVVYVIESEEHGIKGVLINSYGPYSDSDSNEFVAAISNS